MRKFILGVVIIATFASTGSAMAQERIRISSDWGDVTAQLVDNGATRSLVRMLPLTITMRDHLRQEKTGKLPASLPTAERQQDFTVRDIGAVELGRLRDLLSKRSRPITRHRHTRPRHWRCFDLRSPGSCHPASRTSRMTASSRASSWRSSRISRSTPAGPTPSRRCRSRRKFSRSAPASPNTVHIGDVAGSCWRSLLGEQQRWPVPPPACPPASASATTSASA